MTDPVRPKPDYSNADASPFVGPQAWPPSLVARKPSLVLPVMGGLAIVVLALLVFLGLNGQHRSGDAAPAIGTATGPAMLAPGAAAGAPSPMAGAATAPGTAPTVMMPGLGADGTGTPGAGPGLARVAPSDTATIDQAGLSPAGAALPGTVQATTSQRFHGPLVVVDTGGGGQAGGGQAGGGQAGGSQPGAGAALAIGGTGGGSGQAASGASSPIGNGGEGANGGGLSAQLGGGTGSIAPTRLADTARIAPQGTIIPAVLETGINSDLPGFVRAIVGRDVRGYDGTTVLIPRGARLIGQYRNAVAVGQSRAFVVWSRLITPAGLSLDIQSPGTDNTGRSGIAGETHSHFFRRFGNAILLSVLNAGLQAGANSVASPGTAIVIGSQAQASNVASMALQKEIDIPPTVIVNPGTPIRVFVARDLDFTGVAEKPAAPARPNPPARH